MSGAALADALASKVRGRLAPDQKLANFTWFRVGGPADLVFTPADEADLSAFLQVLPADVPVTVIGLASNLLVRDGGVQGVVIRLTGKGFSSVSTEGLTLTAGAGLLDAKAARAAADAGIAGLSFLRGVPGAIGGALTMNAGAYGGEVKDCLVSARAIDRQGRAHTLTNADFDYSYRHSQAPADFIFTEATFTGERGDPAKLLAEMDDIQSARENTQPIKSRTGGSTFKNPPGEKAWQLIDAAGCRGLTIGGAQMAELHCNFMLNTGAATAHDIELLGETVRRRVRDASGIALDWEIKRIGQPAGPAIAPFLDQAEAAA
ncbi:MAG: UDP-N-acetylmuramate dehydrogenase [Pseudomonadota bacterium]